MRKLFELGFGVILRRMLFALGFLVSFESYSSCIDEGIVKFNQKVIAPYLLDEMPDAVPSSSVVEVLTYYAKAGKLSNVWAIDLRDTEAFFDDLKEIITHVKTDKLQVLMLGTTYPDSDLWTNLLLPLMAKDSFRYMNVRGTAYENKGIEELLKLGKKLYPTHWSNLSQKIIFASKAYYPQLKKKGQWIQRCEKDKLIGDKWDETHKNYYKENLDDKLSKANPLKVLTGESDTDDADTSSDEEGSSSSDEE